MDEDLPLSRKSWRLSCYSRLKPTLEEFHDTESDWSTVEDSDDDPIFLHLDVTARLSVAAADTIFENFFLVDSAKWLKAFQTADCLLVSYKCRQKTRIFRLQFKEEENCGDCVSSLKTFFSILPTDVLDGSELTEEEFVLPPIEAHVSQICSRILAGQPLPELYRKCNYEIAKSSDDIKEFITMCLSDPNFPEFVSKVEKALELIMDE